MKKPLNVDEYIGGFGGETKKRLIQVRKLIKTIIPEGEETISYAIPTYKVNGKNLVHFAGFASHIGFYPAPVGLEAFKEELKPYRTGKGTAQFPHHEPLPLGLIKKMTEFRLAEARAQASDKKPKTKKK